MCTISRILSLGSNKGRNESWRVDILESLINIIRKPCSRFYVISSYQDNRIRLLQSALQQGIFPSHPPLKCSSTYIWRESFTRISVYFKHYNLKSSWPKTCTCHTCLDTRISIIKLVPWKKNERVVKAWWFFCKYCNSVDSIAFFRVWLFAVERGETFWLAEHLIQSLHHL